MWRKLAALLLAWTAIFVISYALIEIVLFRHMARLFPPNLPHYFDLGANILFQYSKQGAIPENYIAIFGDSYAEGQGDWFLARQYERMPDTQATHLLHKHTGKDVVTFGVAGSGSIPAYLVYPRAALAYIRSLWFYNIRDPEVIFLYFYEGNDILDNVDDFNTAYLAGGYPLDGLEDPAYFRDFVDRQFLATNAVYQRAIGRDASNNFLFARFVTLLVSATWSSIQSGTFGDRVYHGEPLPLSDSVFFMVAGQKVHAPDHLQMPPVSLSEAELATGIRIFESSVRQVAKMFPDSRVGVVYIPAPAAVYSFSPAHLFDAMQRSEAPVATGEVKVASHRLCNRVRDAALRQGVSFHDVRSAMQAAAQDKLLHGPYDWNHLSAEGYHVLAQELGLFYRELATRHPAVVSSPCAMVH